MKKRELHNFLILLNNPPAFVDRHRISDRRLTAGILAVAAAWREITKIVPLVASFMNRYRMNPQMAEEALEIIKGNAWTPREAESLRIQYLSVLMDDAIKQSVQRMLRTSWPQMRQMVQEILGKRLRRHEFGILLRDTENALQKRGLLPAQEEIFRLRLSICPLCSKVFVRPTLSRAQKYCEQCHRRWPSPKRLWAARQKAKRMGGHPRQGFSGKT